MVQRNRRESRTGNRQPVSAAVLLIAVALISFGIGYMAGRNSTPAAPAEIATATPPQPIAVPKPDPSIVVVEEKMPEEKLTFFETLPKGEQPPLGSGINIPPEEVDAVAATIEQQSAPVKTTPVQSAVSPKPVATTTTRANATATEPHVLQIASFRSPDEAGILVRRLEKKGYQPYIQQADLGSKGIWYRVFLGPYTSKDKAQTASIRLKADEKLDALVRKP